jgi:hypothetical protein
MTPPDELPQQTWVVFSVSPIAQPVSVTYSRNKSGFVENHAYAETAHQPSGVRIVAASTKNRESDHFRNWRSSSSFPGLPLTTENCWKRRKSAARSSGGRVKDHLLNVLNRQPFPNRNRVALTADKS